MRFLKALIKQELKLIHELDGYCNKGPMSDSDKAAFEHLKSKLYHSITKRAKWKEEGEHDTASFCGFEKRMQGRNLVILIIIETAGINRGGSTCHGTRGGAR